jgi:hypothetical protein
MLYLKQSHVVKEELRSLLASGWTAWKRGSPSSCGIDRLCSRVPPLTSMDVGRCMFTHGEKSRLPRFAKHRDRL